MSVLGCMAASSVELETPEGHRGLVLGNPRNFMNFTKLKMKVIVLRPSTDWRPKMNAFLG